MDIQDSLNCGEGSSETREESFDVFLSFSGRDTPSGFVHHLHHSLLHAEISVLRDDGELTTVGEEKGPSHTQAIRHSKIAIPILSENYLSSMPCHAKLAQIVECHKCHKTTGQIIMPVFYSVSPTVVKEGSPDYRKAVAGHKDLKTLQEWKEALIHLGSISEWVSNRLGTGTDASLIDQLVANVLRALNRDTWLTSPRAAFTDPLAEPQSDHRNIALPENLEPEKCSRLWSHKRALDVLKNEKGTEILKGVLLEFGSQSHHSFGPAHFAGTSSIRFLRLDQADLIGNFKGHLSILRWLYWQGCPRNLHPKNLDLEELVILGLSRSMIHEKWNGWIQIQNQNSILISFHMFREIDS